MPKKKTETPNISEADNDSKKLHKEIEAVGEKIQTAKENIQHVIFGQEDVIDLSLITLMAGGHMLIIGVPGLGKTKLVETLSTVMGLETKRIQCTPDLMPADVIGTEIMVTATDGTRQFKFMEGPIFSQLLMADEINRASPRTQSALLQSMQEKRVSIGGIYYDLPNPFHVLATQNPLEQEGTYPLPEAQLDRFMTQVDISYPDIEHEKHMMLKTTGSENIQPEKTLTDKDLLSVQELVRKLPVGENVVDGILTLVKRGRPEESDVPDVCKHVSWGPGPRASQALMLAARAKAMLEGRYTPSLDDVIALAKPVLKHRMALSFSARAEGVTIDSIIDQLCNPLR